MEKSSTKQAILDAALELFSRQGYEATSISQIADAVGIRKASLYSHFAGKQDILDTLVRVTLAQYEQRSVFAAARRDDPGSAPKPPITADDAVKTVLGHVRYILHDPDISRARKMLTIEQFQNPMLAELQTKQNYTDVLRYFTALVQLLVRAGALRDTGDAAVTAAQLSFPITVWINLCDRARARCSRSSSGTSGSSSPYTRRRLSGNTAPARSRAAHIRRSRPRAALRARPAG